MSVPSITAALLARGVCRALDQLGYASLVEFPLANGRRADVVAVGKGGDLVIVEIKRSVADFRADQKCRLIASFPIVSASPWRAGFQQCSSLRNVA